MCEHHIYPEEYKEARMREAVRRARQKRLDEYIRLSQQTVDYLLAHSEDLDPCFSACVDKHFWDLEANHASNKPGETVR